LTGDLISQRLIENAPYDAKRGQVVSSYGFFETIIEGHFWLNYLERTFGSRRTIKTALVKTAVDMAVFGPFEIAMFMAWTNKLEGNKMTLTEKVKNDYLIVLTNSYAYWLPTSIACFYFVPVHLRVLFSCVSSVVWDVFMSFATHNSMAMRDMRVVSV
jgi:hypothetical protein